MALANQKTRPLSDAMISNHYYECNQGNRYSYHDKFPSINLQNNPNSNEQKRIKVNQSSVSPDSLYETVDSLTNDNILNVNMTMQVIPYLS